MSPVRRPLAIVLAILVGFLGLVAVVMDVTTVRIVPETALISPVVYTAVPGALIRVEIDAARHPVHSYDPLVVAPLGGNWFRAAGLGTATLGTVFGPPPGEYYASVLWHVTVEVKPPGL